LSLLCAAAPVTAESPVSFHLSFEDDAYLEEDYSARFDEPAFERRNLRHVPGRFGRALLNDNRFVPEDYEKTYMSPRDLDVLLEVIVHHRFKYYEKGLEVGGMHPYFWGTGRLNAHGGTVAFWACGKRVHPGILFQQGSSSFGRLEKYLIGIDLLEDQSLEAYVVDARYQRHIIRTEPIWTDDAFHHVALVWDRAFGLSLYVDGIVAATNWGETAWWTAQIPGLFHLPMSGFAVDELWLFDRPLTAPEVVRLQRENEPPIGDVKINPRPAAAADRLRRAFVGSGADRLPSVRPSDGTRMVRFREILPLEAGDGCVRAPFVYDGKFEMAWPMGYTSFTNILGDSDFQAEKVDFTLPPEARVNYVTMHGNLTDARLLAVPNDGASAEVMTVPDDGRFFHSGLIEPTRSASLRIPFVKAYGSPPGYQTGLHLPLTGDIRIHEVGFYDVTEPPIAPSSTGRALRLTAPRPAPDDARYGYALRALNGHRDRTVFALQETETIPTRWVPIAPLERFHLLGEPFTAAAAVTDVRLDLHLRGLGDDAFAVVTLHDPGGPARIWNSVSFRLDGFEHDGGVASVLLDGTDIKVAQGDRLWVDVVLSGGGEVQVGSECRSRIVVDVKPPAEADPGYAYKALLPALSSFSKIYSWYYPWILTRETYDPLGPVTFGGFYDILTYPMLVRRVEPNHFVSDALIKLSLVDAGVEPDYAFPAWENAPRFWPPIPTTQSDDSPDWAFNMHHYLTRYEGIVHTWADRQNPDGQVGGGWNDDVLFAGRLCGPLLYTGDRKARVMFDRIFEGLERTRMFDDGYCNITPIDGMHVKDLVRNRYEGLLFDPGDPKKMKSAMRTAWRLNKPDRTPLNYADGTSFKYDHALIQWYWGRTPEFKTYTTTRKHVTERVKALAPSMNDVIRWRYTESGMFTDGFNMPGGREIRTFLVGGEVGPFVEALTLAASWETGGEAAIPKWVEHASDTRFVAHLYSYAHEPRDVTMRLFRLKKGIYRITLSPTGRDEPDIVRTRELRRFSMVTVPVRPGREMTLRIELERALPSPGPLPDLAIDRLRAEGSRLRAEVLNFGAAVSGPFIVRLEDALGRTVAEQTVAGLESAADFVPGVQDVVFDVPSPSAGPYRVVVDPDHAVEEIATTNNTAFSSPSE
jgi:hypothetical protein